MNQDAAGSAAVRRRLGRFALKCALAYCLLIAPWPGWHELGTRLFRTSASTALTTLGTEGQVRFRAPTDVSQRHGPLTSVVLFVPDPPRRKVMLVINTHRKGFLPAALLCALWLATRVTWRQRLLCLGVGLVTLQAVLLGRVWLELVSLSGQENGLVEGVSSKAAGLLHAASPVFYHAILPNFALPVLIWWLALAVCQSEEGASSFPE